jgi:diaminopimelate epimerase
MRVCYPRAVMKTTWMSGAGNLFVMLDGFADGLPADAAAYARDACARPGPEGRRPDGVILVKPPRSGGDCVMEIYNADGSRPETCGNGLRCVAKLVFDRHHVTTTTFVIETDAGPVRARVDGGRAAVERATIAMGVPRIVARDERLRALGREHAAVLVDVGNPHCVLFVEDERAAPVATLGPALEKHARFPRGTNVEFLALRNDGAFLRVWERGVGETQACGTGACAAAWAAVDAGRARWPVVLSVPGGTLVVDSDGAGGVTLEGPVEEHRERTLHGA